MLLKNKFQSIVTGKMYKDKSSTFSFCDNVNAVFVFDMECLQRFFFNLNQPRTAKNTKFRFFQPTLCLFFTIEFEFLVQIFF